MHDGMHNLRVGEWLVEPSAGRITRTGSCIKLEPRVMDVLLYLAERTGVVVTREELERSVWKGRIVSYEALSSCMLKLRKALQDDARHPRYIETVSKKGYRLLAPVEYLESPVRQLITTKQDEISKLSLKGRRLRTAPFIILLLVVLAVLVKFFISPDSEHMDDTSASTSSIAVLPFDNLSGDPEQEYFADGMTDDLITELAKNPNLFVIARDSTFVYKNDPVNIPELAEKLKVNYILRGSVRRIGDQIRINAQLIDTRSGSHLWAEHYEASSQDIFSLQDGIISKIFSALSVKLYPAGEKLNPYLKPRNPLAYDYFLHARNHFFQYASKEENLKARALYLQALELDPDYASAQAMLAWTYAFEAMNGWSEERTQSLQTALSLAGVAISLDPELPVAYFVTGLAYRELGQHEKARAEAEKALQLEPSYANAHVLLATLLYYAGRAEEGLKLIQRAMRLNPHHPYNYPFHLGQAYFILEKYDQSITAFKQGLDSNPSSERLRLWLASAYALSGRIEDAKWEVDQVIALDPSFSMQRIMKAFPFQDEADLNRFERGLKLAGFDKR